MKTGPSFITDNAETLHPRVTTRLAVWLGSPRNLAHQCDFLLFLAVLVTRATYHSHTTQRGIYISRASEATAMTLLSLATVSTYFSCVLLKWPSFSMTGKLPYKSALLHML